MRAQFIFVAVLGLGILVTGCVNPLKGLLVTKGQKEKEIAALKVEYDNKVNIARSEVSAAKDVVIADKNRLMVEAAGSFVAQKLVFDAIVQPTRTDLLFRNYANEGHAALGNVQPSAQTLREIAERVARERDEARTSLSQLQAAHQQALTEKTAIAEQAKKHEAELTALQTKLSNTERDGALKLATKQAELIALQDKVIAAEKARSADAAALQALKTKISVILGICALVGIAGAVYSPVMKQQCAVFGAICGLSAIGIWYIQPWHVAAVAGVVVLGVIGWILAKHRKEERVSDALVLAAQDIKEQSAETWKQIAPTIEERLKKYTKKGGKLVAEKDHDIEAYIEAKKADWDRL